MYSPYATAPLTKDEPAVASQLRLVGSGRLGVISALIMPTSTRCRRWVTPWCPGHNDDAIQLVDGAFVR